MKDTEIQSAIELLRAMTDWAYETGFHESGYDPIRTISTALSELRSEINRLQSLFAQNEAE